MILLLIKWKTNIEKALESFKFFQNEELEDIIQFANYLTHINKTVYQHHKI